MTTSEKVQVGAWCLLWILTLGFFTMKLETKSGYQYIWYGWG